MKYYYHSLNIIKKYTNNEKIFFKNTKKILKKIKLFFFLNKFQKNFYIKKNYLFYKKFYIVFNPTLVCSNYFIFKENYTFMKLNKINFFYLILNYKNISYYISKIKNKNKHLLYFYKFNNFNFYYKFTYVYKTIINVLNYEIFFFLKNIFKKFKKNFFKFILNFNYNNKLVMNLNNNNNKKKKNYCFLSPGFFIKFFEKKKCFKKSKIIKFLMIKYFKKLLIIINIQKLFLIIKKIPVYLNEIINLFNQTIVLNMNNDKKKIKSPIFSYIFFLENKNYNKNKLKKKGRVKRKIIKKLTYKNKIID